MCCLSPVSGALHENERRAVRLTKRTHDRYAISAFTLTDALGAGRAATAGRVAGAAQRAGAGDLHGPCRCPPGVGEVPASTPPACPSRWPNSIAATTALPGGAASKTGSSGGGVARARLGRRPGSPCSWEPAPRVCCRPSSLIAGAHRVQLAGPTFTTARRKHLLGRGFRACTHCSCKARAGSSRRPCRPAPRCSAPRPDDRAGLVDAAVVGGVDSPVPVHAVRLQLSGAVVRRNLPALGRRPTQGLVDCEAAHSHWSSARRSTARLRCWASAKPTMATTEHAPPKARARSRRCAAHSPLQACRRPTSTTSTCTHRTPPTTLAEDAAVNSVFGPAARLAVRTKGATGIRWGSRRC